MKRITTVLFATGLFATLLSGCKEEYTTYSDAEYLMFADTMSVNPVLQDQEYFRVPVSSTVACDYDRTFGVEIVDKGSNAIEGYHYRLRSNTITIKAGERATDVLVEGIYDHFEPTDSLGFTLKLVMPEALAWNAYGDWTKVVMRKSCPYNLDDFTGYCVVTSMFLNSYPGIENKSIQRLVKTKKHPTEPNTIILESWLFTGYDIVVRLDPSDPADPEVIIDKDQVLSDEASVFGQILGDNRILVRTSPYYDSVFNSCQKFMGIWIQAYVRKLGTDVGTVGDFYNVLEWVSDEEARRLQREEGM